MSHFFERLSLSKIRMIRNCVTQQTNIFSNFMAKSFNPYLLGLKFGAVSGCARWERTKELALNAGIWKSLF